MSAPKTTRQFMALPEVASFTRVEHTITEEDVSLGFFSLNVGGDIRRVPFRDVPVGEVLSFPVMNSFRAVWSGEADISRVVTKDGAFHLAQDGAGNYVRVRKLG